MEVALTVIALVAVCAAGVLALPWTDAEVEESADAWSTLGREAARLARAMLASSK